MLTAVPDMADDARTLLGVADSLRPALWVLVELLLLPALGVCLLAVGHVWALSLIGATVALALSRYGPHWWPGRR